jgi:hypothetical protein
MATPMLILIHIAVPLRQAFVVCCVFIFLRGILLSYVHGELQMARRHVECRMAAAVSLVSRIFLLWHEARRVGVAVAVSSASGYISRMTSVVRVCIASRHISWRSALLSKWAIAGGIYFWRTSPITCYHLLLAQILRPQDL